MAAENNEVFFMKLDSTKKLILALLGGALGFFLPEILNFLSSLLGG